MESRTWGENSIGTLLVGSVNPDAKISMDLLNKISAFHQKPEMLEHILIPSSTAVVTHTGLLSSPAYNNFDAQKTYMCSPGSTWVIDSGATNHTTGKQTEFGTFRLSAHGDIRVVDEDYIKAMCEGSVNDTLDVSLPSILYVPQSAHNHMSVSSLTRSHNCSISFYPLYCVFRDLKTGQIIGDGKEYNGLYCVDQAMQSNVALQPSANTLSKNTEESLFSS